MDEDVSPAERITRAMGFIGSRRGPSQSNVTRGEMGVLGYLSFHDSAAPSDLAEKFNVTSSRIANTLKALERKGLILRDINPDDRRGIIVTITPAGRAFGVERYREAIVDSEHQLSVLSEVERERLASLIEKLARGLAARDGVPYGPVDRP